MIVHESMDSTQREFIKFLMDYPDLYKKLVSKNSHGELGVNMMETWGFLDEIGIRPFHEGFRITTVRKGMQWIIDHPEEFEMLIL